MVSRCTCYRVVAHSWQARWCTHCRGRLDTVRKTYSLILPSLFLTIFIIIQFDHAPWGCGVRNGVRWCVADVVQYFLALSLDNRASTCLCRDGRVWFARCFRRAKYFAAHQGLAAWSKRSLPRLHANSGALTPSTNVGYAKLTTLSTGTTRCMSFFFQINVDLSSADAGGERVLRVWYNLHYKE